MTLPRRTPPVVLISESGAATVVAASRRAHPHEVGGILLGVHADQRPWITLALELPTSDRGRSHYRLPGGATQAAVRAAREVDPRLGYLGDWHSHTRDVGPSPTDRATMRRLAYTQGFGPLLLVVRRTGRTYALDVRQRVFTCLNRRRLVLTGDLPRNALK